MSEVIGEQSNPEFSPDDDQRRLEKSRAEIRDALSAELLVKTDSGIPFDRYGIEINEEMLETDPGPQSVWHKRVKDEAVERVRIEAEKKVEDLLNLQEQKDIDLAFDIVCRLFLKRNLLQQAGNEWVKEKFHKPYSFKGTTRDTNLHRLIGRVLDYDYLPPREILEEATLSYLKELAKRHNPMRDYEELQNRLKEHHIDIVNIIEQDTELVEILTKED